MLGAPKKKGRPKTPQALETEEDIKLFHAFAMQRQVQTFTLFFFSDT
jgi:hypothetical protein